MSLLNRMAARLGLRDEAHRTPPDERVYAIGDIHGRSDLLRMLLDRIVEDLRTQPIRHATIVFLGDVIDRGPDSAGVIDLLAAIDTAFATVFLIGNHEELLFRVMDAEPDALQPWLEHGGDAFVRSYGITPASLISSQPDHASTVLHQAVPAAHQAIFRKFRSSFRLGGYLFVHAGIRPGVPLDRQSDHDLRWIREPFLSDRQDHGAVVVHGHTVTTEPDERPNRIGVDTGAYRTGRLTAVALEGDARRFLSVQDG